MLRTSSHESLVYLTIFRSNVRVVLQRTVRIFVFIKKKVSKIHETFERVASNAERLIKNFERLVMSVRTAH